MNALAEPNSTPTTEQKARPGRSISRHPLFPAVAGLWAAAILVIASAAFGVPLLERVIALTHVDSLIPAAAAPVGVTARLLLALALGAVGGVAGYVLAWKRANPKQKAVRKVFSVADAQLGAPPIWPSESAETEIEPEAAASPEPEAEGPALPDDGEAQAAPAAVAEPAIEPVAEAVTAPPPHPASPTAAQRIAHADLADLSHVELMERLAIALQRRQELVPVEAATTEELVTAVVPFPGLADRQITRAAPPSTLPRPVPQKTEQALREALAQLQRIRSNG